MKKCMVMAMALSAACMQGMENGDANSWSITVGKTKINVIKGFVGDAGDRVHTIVVGKNQQRILKAPSMGDIQDIGNIHFNPDKIIYQKSKDDQSASDDDTYKPYEHADYSSKSDATKIWKRAAKVEVKASLFSIIEPRIMKTDSFDDDCNEIEVPYYINKKSCWDGAEGAKALEEAAKDLKMCYEKIFDNVAKNEKEKSIALQALSTEVGFPREKAADIAVKSVLEFIQNNSDACNVVELYVKKRSEFALYKELLEKSAAEK